MNPRRCMDKHRLVSFLKCLGYTVRVTDTGSVVAGCDLGSVRLTYVGNGWSIRVSKIDGKRDTFVDLDKALDFLQS